MTQGGPAFLTSDITRWECAPQKNTNKMYSRAGGGGQAAGRCAPEPPRSPPRVPQPRSSTARPLPGRAKPQPSLRGRSRPLPLAPGDARVRAPASPRRAPRPGKGAGGKVTCCGSVLPKEAAELPWDFAWRMPEGVFKDLRCFSGWLVVVIFCLVFVSFCIRVSLGQALLWVCHGRGWCNHSGTGLPSPLASPSYQQLRSNANGPVFSGCITPRCRLCPAEPGTQSLGCHGAVIPPSTQTGHWD